MSEGASDEELESTYLDDARPRPWLLVNMVASLDGGTEVAGRSSVIGDAQDSVVFRSLRAASDLILVAAATARAERYGPPRLPERLVRWRQDRGMAPSPRLAIVSRSLDFDVDAFEDAPPIVVTSEGSPPDRRKELAERTDVVVAGGERVDMTDALHRMRESGHDRILCEGGPSLNGQLALEDLVDEWCLTISPLVLSGDSKRIVSGPGLDDGRRVVLDRVVRGRRSIFTRWLRADPKD